MDVVNGHHVKENKDFNITSGENMELPFIYKFNNYTSTQPLEEKQDVRSTQNGVECNDGDENVLFTNDLNGGPGLKKHMQSLYVLQSRQKELDSWYKNMHKQLEIEKFRLTEKYEELHLKNIREQQSIIDSSQEFLRCASNNNTPGLVDANCKQLFSNDFDKTQMTPVFSKLGNNSLRVNNSSLVVDNFSCPTYKSSPMNCIPVVESECVKNSLEYATPCATPDQNIDDKSFENAVQSNGGDTDCYTENVGDVCLSDYNEEVENDTTRTIPNGYVITNNNNNPIDSIRETQNSSLPSINGFSETKFEEDENNAKKIQMKPRTPVTNNNKTISNMDADERESQQKSSLNSNHKLKRSKISSIPNELKTLISVPPRQRSQNVMNSLEYSENGFKKLFDNNFEDLKSRRQSRPIKYFPDPFPAEMISSGDYTSSSTTQQQQQQEDDSVFYQTGTSPVRVNGIQQQPQQQQNHSVSYQTGASPLRSDIIQQEEEQKQQQQQQNHSVSYQTGTSPLRSHFIQQEQEQQQQKDHSISFRSGTSPSRPHNIQQQQQKQKQNHSDSYETVTSPVRGNIISHSPINSSTTSPQHNHTTPEKSTTKSPTAVYSQQFDNKHLNGEAGTNPIVTLTDCAVPTVPFFAHSFSSSTSMVSSYRPVCSTSTPHKFEEKSEQGLLLEISAVTLQKTGEVFIYLFI